MISDTPFLHQSNNTVKEKRNYEDMYFLVGAVKAKYYPSLSPEKLIKMWEDGLNTVIKTLDTTNHLCNRSTGLLVKRLKTYKSQLRYKQHSFHYGTFNVDYLKVGVKSAR